MFACFSMSPQWTKPWSLTVVTCLSIHPPNCLPFTVLLLSIPTSASWDHLPNKLLEPKSLSQYLLLWNPVFAQVYLLNSFSVLCFLFVSPGPSYLLIWAFSVNIFVSYTISNTLRSGPCYLYLVVCNEIFNNQLFKKKKVLTCGIDQFVWYKCSHHGQLQAIK